MIVLWGGLTACAHSGADEVSYDASNPGDQMHRQGDDAGAARFYQNGLQSDPDDAQTRLKLAQLFEAHSDLPHAQEQYEFLLQKNPDVGALHRDLGRVLLKQGKAADAKNEYETALSLDSGDTKALNGLGIALDYLGNHRAAQDAYKQALSINSDDLTSLNNLAHSYVLSGNYNEAIALLEPHLNGKGATPALRQNLAEAYGMAGMDVDAERVGRMDLSAEQVQHNIAYYHARREQLAVAPKFYADLGAYPTEAMAENRVERIRADFAKETAALVINVTPEVKTSGGVPSFSVTALGFTNAAKAKVFCDRLRKENIACIAHG